MKKETSEAIPRQRVKDLVVRVHGEETLVLDRRSNTVHCLPAKVTRVWGACTGSKTLAEIATVAGIDELTAASAVDQLMEHDLLEVPAGVDRRKFLERSALVGAGAVTVTAIASVVAPTAASAATEIIYVPSATLSCSGRLNTGSTNTTVNFQVSLSGFPAPGTYNVTAVPTDVPFYASNGSMVVSFGSVNVVGPGGSTTGSGQTSTEPIVGPPGPPSGGPLPAGIPVLITVTPVSPSGPPVMTVVTFSNPCCATGGCSESAGSTSSPAPGQRSSRAQHPAAGSASPRTARSPAPTTSSGGAAPTSPVVHHRRRDPGRRR